MDITMVLRDVTKQLAYSDTFTNGVQAIAPKLGFKPYIGGTTHAEIIETCKALQASGQRIAIDYIGNAIIDAADVTAEKNNVRLLMQQLHAEGLSAVFTLQPEQFGLLLDVDECYNMLYELAEVARTYEHFITLQTAEYAHVQTIISMTQQLQESFDHISTVVQAHFYRAQEDVETFRDVALTLTKKVCNESEAVAFQDKMDIDLNMIELIEQRFQTGSYTVIATHDKNIIAFAKRRAAEYNLPQTSYEFQFHIGQDVALQESLVQEGYNVRTYFPAGAHWHTHFTTHVANRPQNMKYVSDKVFTKKTNTVLALLASVWLLRKLLKLKK